MRQAHWAVPPAPASVSIEKCPGHGELSTTKANQILSLVEPPELPEGLKVEKPGGV